jgi:GDP-4-dehydro-6-deoxy-D-mannose reductase
MARRAEFMRVLVTGVAGFAGRYATRELVRRGHEVIGLDRIPAPTDLPLTLRFIGDLTRPEIFIECLRDAKPDACLHLAGLAFVPQGVAQPRVNFELNTLGVLNLLEAARQSAPDLRILVVTTAQIYGPGQMGRETPVEEDAPLRPDSLYTIAKAAADETALLYARQFHLQVLTARPHNHTGPGQSPAFAVPAFAHQIHRMVRGEIPAVLRTGNPDSLRDFTDVRDIVKAYALLLEGGRPGQAYNIASGRLVRMGDIIDRLTLLAKINFKRETSPDLIRPTDSSIRVSTQRIRQETGWTPEIELDTTLQDLWQSLSTD